MTHRTPIDYLNYYRIERACYQLITTNLSITEIAYASGFNDLSYFIKTFKKYKGNHSKKYLKYENIPLSYITKSSPQNKPLSLTCGESP